MRSVQFSCSVMSNWEKHSITPTNYDVVRNTLTESWEFIKLKTTMKKKWYQQIKEKFHGCENLTSYKVNYSKTQ